MTPEDYTAIRDELNRLHAVMTAAPTHVKAGFSLTVGGVLNAYREGDIAFNEACKLLRMEATK